MIKYPLYIIRIIALLTLFAVLSAAKSDSLLLEKPLLLKWRSNITAHSLVATDKKIIVTQNDGNIIVLSAIDGKTLWRVNHGGKINILPIIINSTIYYPSSFSVGTTEFTSIRSLNLETGTTIWKKEIPNLLESLYSNDDQLFIYCLLKNSTLITLKKSNGDIVETVTIPSVKKSDKIYFVNENLLCIINPFGIKVFSLRSKSIVWQTTFPANLNADVISLQEYLILSTSNNYIYAFNSLKGKLLWKKKVTTKPQTLYMVKNGIFVSNTENYIYFLSIEGKLKWKKLIPGRFSGYYLSINSSMLLFPQSNDTGIVLDIAKGNVLNRLQINSTDFVQIPPVTTDKFLILQTQNGLEAYTN